MMARCWAGRLVKNSEFPTIMLISGVRMAKIPNSRRFLLDSTDCPDWDDHVRAGQGPMVFQSKKPEPENRWKFGFFATKTPEISKIVGNSHFLTINWGGVCNWGRCLIIRVFLKYCLALWCCSRNGTAFAFAFGLGRLARIALGRLGGSLLLKGESAGNGVSKS